MVSLAYMGAACVSSAPIGQAEDVTVLDNSSLPSPPERSIASSREGGTLAPGDTVTMQVYGAEDFTASAQIEDDGLVEFPFTGSINAAGMRRSDLAAEIARRLSPQILLDPQVSLEVENGAARQITIGGEVERPGFYSSTQANSLLRSVVAAGGLTDAAERREVLLIREVKGRRYIGVFNVTAIERGNYGDPPVYSGDVIMVGESALLRKISIYAPLVSAVTSPLILLDRVLTR
ncbi:hypothetical protein MTsPCn7_27280 [Altererythrobacter sp. MTPC7]